MPLPMLVREPIAVTEDSVVQAQIGAALSQVAGPLVAKVLAYNDATQRATVQPVAQWTGTGPQPITMQPMANVPVQFIGGNGFTIVCGLAPGDFVTVIFLGRSHDEWFATGAVGVPPSSWRQNSLSDAVIVAVLTPDVAPLTALQARPGELVIGTPTGVQIRINQAGQVRIGTATVDLVGTLETLLTTMNTTTAVVPATGAWQPAILTAIVNAAAALNSLKIP